MNLLFTPSKQSLRYNWLFDSSWETRKPTQKKKSLLQSGLATWKTVIGTASIRCSRLYSEDILCGLISHKCNGNCRRDLEEEELSIGVKLKWFQQQWWEHKPWHSWEPDPCTKRQSLRFGPSSWRHQPFHCTPRVLCSCPDLSQLYRHPSSPPFAFFSESHRAGRKRSG